MRFAYTRSLGGVSFDQSVRLEPSQVAGFNQAFRSLIPEAIAGSTAGAKFETFGLALEQKFKTGTYLAVEGQILDSEVGQTVGVVNLDSPSAGLYPAPARARTGLHGEKSHRDGEPVLGDCWSLGARYQLSRAELRDDLPGNSRLPFPAPTTRKTAPSLTNSPCSPCSIIPPAFSPARKATGIRKAMTATHRPLPGDDFWQVNLFGGYRFWHRHAQMQVGVLNLTDQDYHLNPLNLYTELPRQRTFAVNFQFNF